MAIDGADQLAPSGRLIKGGGGANSREKIVAAAADRFVVIVSAKTVVARIVPPVPLELFEFGLAARLAQLGDVRLGVARRSPDGGIIAGFTGECEDPEEQATRLSHTAGVVDHGLFGPALVSDILVASGEQIERIEVPVRGGAHLIHGRRSQRNAVEARTAAPTK